VPTKILFFLQCFAILIAIAKIKVYNCFVKNSFEKEYIPVFYAPDDKCTPLALTSMISIMENTDKNVHFIILYSGLSKESRKCLDTIKKYKNCKLSYKAIRKGIFKGFPVAGWVTVNTWFRCLIPDLYAMFDKAIYLDCDTLLNGDIFEFYNIDILDKFLAAITDVWGAKNYIKRLNMKSTSYFNAGVLLINCKKWRENNIFEKIKDCALDDETIKYSDQDVLNKIIDEDKLVLSPKYNYLEGWWHNYYNEYEGWELTEYNKAKTQPLIIHFTGTKPNTLKSKHSFKEKWWQYFKKSRCYIDFLENYRLDFYKEKKNLEIKFSSNKNKLREINKILAN